MRIETRQHHCFLGTIDTVDGRSGVQHVASVANLPKQIAIEWGEPTSNEVANATESAPKRTVEVGGQRPAAERSAATLLGASPSGEVCRRQRSSVQDEWRGSDTKLQVCHRQMRNAALKQGSRASRGGPKEGCADCWRSEATKGKQKCADAAFSRINTAKSPLGDRPKDGSMVLIFVRRAQVFLRLKWNLNLIVIRTQPATKQYLK